MSEPREKPFVLAPVKSPEQEKKESIGRRMPELRRRCAEDRKLLRWVGAKWLFDQLTDDSFMHSFGGDSQGRVFVTFKYLSKRFGHDAETLSAWCHKLEEAGWIWMRRHWDKWEIGIADVVSPPSLLAPESLRQEAMASLARSENEPVKTRFARQSGGADGPNPVLTDCKPGSHRSAIGSPPGPNRVLTGRQSVSTGVISGEKGDRITSEPDLVSARTGFGVGVAPVGDRQEAGSQPGRDGKHRESPRSLGALETLEGGGGAAVSPPPEFDPEVNYRLKVQAWFPSRLEKALKANREELARLKEDPANFTRVLKPEAEEDMRFGEELLAKARAEKNQAKVKELANKLAAINAKAENWQAKGLTPQARARKIELQMRIKVLEELLK